MNLLWSKTFEVATWNYTPSVVKKQSKLRLRGISGKINIVLLSGE